MKNLIDVIRDGLNEYEDNKEFTYVTPDYLIRKHVCVFLDKKFMDCVDDNDKIDEKCIFKLWLSIME